MIVFIAINYVVGLLLVYKPFYGILAFIFSLGVLIKKKNKKYYTTLLGIIPGCFFAYLSHLNSSFDYHNTIGIVLEAKKDYFIIWCKFNKLYIYQKDNDLQVFDIIRINEGIESVFTSTTYEMQFSFKEKMNNMGVCYKLDNVNYSKFITSKFRYKEIINYILNKYEQEKTVAIVSRILFSYSYSKEWDNLIYGLGLSYVFCLSSFHIYFLIEVIRKVLIKKIEKKKIDIFTIFVLFALLFISNYKISVLKIFVLYIVKYISSYTKYNFTYFERLVITFFIILLIKPYLILEQSFVLSICLAFYILLAQKGISNIRKKYQSLVFTIYIYLFMIPYLIKTNCSFSLINPFLVCFYGPFTIVIYLLSLFTFMLPFHGVLDFICKTTYNSVELLSYNKMIFVIGEINILFYILYYFILSLSLFFLENKQPKFTKIAITSEILLLSITSLPIKNYIHFEVDFINVGQGDAMLIQERNYNVLIDTGGKNNMNLTQNTLIPFFHKRRIKHLNALFLTHNDYDHSGEKERLIQNFRVDNVIENTSYFTEMKIGNINITNLNKYYNLTMNENEKSMVLYIELYNKTFLCMGDAPKSIEKKITNDYPDLKCDYLKVGHHGSNTSSSKEFISQVSPKEAIISVGEGNFYGHPNKEVIDTLEYYQIKVRRTDIEGTIRYSFRIPRW